MKKPLFLFLLSLFLLNSCYVYKPYQPKEGEKALSIEQQITPNQTYKIYTNSRTYKVQALKWEADSLVVQTNVKKGTEKKIGKNEITKVEPRTFSKFRSDLFTVLSYVGLGVGLVILL